MAQGADVKLASGPRGEVCAAYGSRAVADWESLDLQEQEKLRQRFVALCTADDMLDHRKVRLLKCKTKGIYEIKIKRPPLRAYAFRDGRWWITHIETKPKDSRVEEEGARAGRFRDEHNRRAGKE